MYRNEEMSLELWLKGEGQREGPGGGLSHKSRPDPKVAGKAEKIIDIGQPFGRIPTWKRLG